jgi:alpha-ketoglutarate-dependent 2,4-dichlorophenoxyacetate dioxygenase
MTLRIEPIRHDFVGEVFGVDLRHPLDDAHRRAIDAAMDIYGVLVFHDQPLSTAEQVAFATSFGPLDFGLRAATKAANPYASGIDDVSNVEGDKVADRSSHQVISSMANRLWHKDCGGGPVSYSILNASVVPAEGGETEFADMRGAFDALPPALLQEAEGKRVYHRALQSRLQLGMTYTPEQLDALPLLELPLVRVHPGSGRKHLFIGAHASHVKDMTVAEGRVLLMELLEHATGPRFVYRHVWAPADLVMWDNRSTLHRGRRYDIGQPRKLRRVTITDVARERASA